MTENASPAAALDWSAVEALIRMALAEDVGAGDVTTRSVCAGAQAGTSAIHAKAPGVIAGIEVARRVFLQVDAHLTVIPACQDGARVQAGQAIVTVHGDVDAMLTAERTALNFLGHLSGIATQTAAYVAAVAGTRAKITDTRKTTPGLRLLEKYAVHVGGGVNHRMGLYDMVLIKDNHIAAAGGIPAALARVREAFTRTGRALPVEVEAETPADVKAALAAGVDRILLDNMSPALLRDMVALVEGRVPLEASGGITAENVRAVAETGVDLISVGALTHSSRALDLSMEVTLEG